MLAIVAMAGIAIGAGHALGGPDPVDRASTAFASAMRHPGIALTVATANVPEEPRLVAAVVLYLVVAFALTSVYGSAMRRWHARADSREQA
jgi:BASS family bile acid:Na+ symporter